jgi:hypothetical protein
MTPTPELDKIISDICSDTEHKCKPETLCEFCLVDRARTLAWHHRIETATSKALLHQIREAIEAQKVIIDYKRAMFETADYFVPLATLRTTLDKIEAEL